MSEPHFCASCGVERKAFPRYPWHFCNDCRDLAVDFKGRKVKCGNEGMGGFAFSIEGVEGVYACRGVLVRVKGRQVRIQEARFGGVVAEPWTTSIEGKRGLVDLTSREPDFSKLRRIDKKARRTAPVGRGRLPPVDQ